MKNKSYDKKIFRLIHILQRLNGGGVFKTSDLAQEFNVTARTIQRDLELLNSAGFPLVYEEDRYKFVDGFSLQKITVTPSEKFLLNSFFDLFSKAGEPLNSVAKDFLGKILSVPQRNGHTKGLDHRKKEIIKKEVKELSKSIEAKLEDLNFPPQFKSKIDEFLDTVESRLAVLRKKERVNIRFNRTGQYQQRQPIATISIPKTYFNDPNRKFDFSESQKDRIFQIKASLPSKFFHSLMIVLQIKLNFKFWGPHLKPKSITCFDQFADYLGFSNKQKEFHYEASYGSSNRLAKVLITRAGMSWSEIIPMSAEEIKPFLKKTGGIWICSDYSKKK